MNFTQYKVQAGSSKMPCLELHVEPYMTLLIGQTVSKLSYPLDTSANNQSNKIETPFAVHGFANLVKSLSCVHRILSKKGNICSPD